MSNIKTVDPKFSVGDTVFSGQKKGTVRSICVRVWQSGESSSETSISIEYGVFFDGSNNNYVIDRYEEDLMTREEAIRAFEAKRSEEFLRLFG
jgi:hypothetical protein